MASVTILDQTYTLPAIRTEQFDRLSRQVREQQHIIQDGRRPRVPLMGFIPRTPVPLSPEERFTELHLLIHNYDTIIAALRESQDAYQHFFAQLAAGIRGVIMQKSVELGQLEQERLEDEQIALANQDTVMQQITRTQGERHLRDVRWLGRAALLLLRKIALCQDGLKHLVEDQAVQRQVLEQLTGRLALYQRAYERDKRLQQLEAEITKIAEVALHFEEYMRAHLGPLQELLDQVVQVDNRLHNAVAEIETLTQQMLRDSGGLLPDGTTLDESLLDFLTAGQLKKERLIEVWERLERQDDDIELDIDIATSESSATSPVLTALDNIRTLVEVRLAPLAPAPLTATPEMTPESPFAWLAPAQATEAPDLAEEASSPGVVSVSPSISESIASQCQQVQRSLSHINERRARWPWRVPVSPSEPQLVERFGIKFVLIPAGTFQMGSEHGGDDEKPVHTVHLNRSFYLGMYPVTQRQWKAVMERNPSSFQGLEHPVEKVSWYEVQDFIRSLNTKEGMALYRLPTEAEWEYAARAGATGDYCFGDDVTRLFQYAWYADNAGGSTQPVGQLLPNAWGLYDMHGNVSEWVQDWYESQEYAKRVATDTAVVNPPGPAAGSTRVLRGGYAAGNINICRSAFRTRFAPGDRYSLYGFRLLREVQ